MQNAKSPKIICHWISSKLCLQTLQKNECLLNKIIHKIQKPFLQVLCKCLLSLTPPTTNSIFLFKNLPCILAYLLQVYFENCFKNLNILGFSKKHHAFWFIWTCYQKFKIKKERNKRKNIHRQMLSNRVLYNHRWLSFVCILFYLTEEGYSQIKKILK